MFKGLKAWIKTRKPQNANANELMEAIKFSNKVKSFCSRLWAIVAGICTIVAAIFSVLSFFKD